MSLSEAWQPEHTIVNGKYRIIRMIGCGNFGEVYEAEELVSGVIVAIKRMRSGKTWDEIQTDQAKRRFLFELQVGRFLNSQLLVRATTVEKEGGEDLIVMEYMPGGSLKQQIEQANKERTQIPLQKAVQWCIETAEGLAVLHEASFVHRDVKPSNILLDKKSHAHLGDLGVLQDPNTQYTTDHEQQPGTIAYMAPEQRSEKYILLKPSADVYALGCVLFELLTGKLYCFTKEGTRPCALRSDVPRWLDGLVMQMLAEEAKQRPENGEKVAKLLRQGWQAEEAAQSSAAEGARKLHQQEQERARQEFERLEKQRQEMDQRKAWEEEARRRQKLELAQRQAEERVRAQARAETWRRVKPWLLGGAALSVGVVLLGVVVYGVTVMLGNLPRSTSSPQVTVISETPIPIVETPIPTVMNSLTPIPTTEITPTATEPVLPEAKYAPGATQVSPKDGMVQVYVPAGEFLMGSTDADSQAQSNEKPQHTVYLDAYWIDRTEVTVAMFKKFITGENYQTDADKAGWGHVYNESTKQWEQLSGANWQYPRGPGEGEGIATHPVLQVSWNDAQAYCQWAGRTLPTEAQWEKAARGTDGRIYPWGSGSDCNKANYGGCVGDTTEVGSYESGGSPYGALDMAGNVWEWVADWYGGDNYTNSPASNPTGPSTGDNRVRRGGSWDGYDFYVRAAFRGWDVPTYGSGNFGFRCAFSP